MPSNFTANYQLSQWKKTDQVKMEDFNEDNDKIDAALFSKIGKPELIQAIDLHENYGSVLDLDLSGIDWNAWRMVFVALTGKCVSSTNDHMYMDIPLSHPGSSNLGYGDPGGRALLFFPDHSENNPVRLIAFPTAEPVFCEAPFSDLNSMRFLYHGGGYISVSSKIFIYGLR